MDDKYLLEPLWKKVRKKKNVVGYSSKLQPKIKNGKEFPEYRVFRVYVTKKEDISLLSKGDVVPMAFKVGDREFIMTDIVEIGEIRAFGVKDRIRPVKAGVSAMGWWGTATACTLGNFVRNRMEEEEPFIGIIANNHCAANENKAGIGTPYTQPSKGDGGTDPRDRVGELWRFVEIKFSEFVCPFRNFFHRIYRTFAGTDSNRVDIALIKPVGDNVLPPYEVYEIGPFYGKRRAVSGELLQKVGRTTGHTVDGIVADTSWNGYVGYSRGSAFFEDCLLVDKKDFGAGGDSSSPIGSMGERPDCIAQLFAGSDTHTIGCYIDNIESELKVELIISP